MFAMVFYPRLLVLVKTCRIALDKLINSAELHWCGYSVIPFSQSNNEGLGAGSIGPYDSHWYPAFTRRKAYSSSPLVRTLIIPGNISLNRLRAVSFPTAVVKSRPSIAVPSVGAAVSPSPTKVAAISVENTSGLVERDALPMAAIKFALGCPWSGASPDP